nr:immunoglobulin heavy chain junction region [Macaca mulatta]MOV56041.1 immunoglobulin heavy chain junction region [Macaca mulatta]MOV56544.1 immunoglobulin heavy chain junction region [Macaca mulatta]MOV56868.1 immunoglobulin heavy chain junction region [Macaca mulatta]MOV57900.1 immunoglobulin heavy chain junction region [Macaca mulatta]
CARLRVVVTPKSW